MLQVEKLSFAIGGSPILNGVTFAVKAGETVGLIGPNGSGKTTLFNCINGFNPIGSGKLIFKGKDISRTSPHERAILGIGRVFQNFGIFREMTVRDNVVTALESRQSILRNVLPWGGANRKNKARAADFLAQVGLEGKAEDKAGSLSGGQMRLLEIVRTLAYGAELFLLDEPTAGVSPRMKEDVAQVIRKLQELGKTVLVIEHDITFIQKFCRRIVVLDLGRIVLDDSPENVRSNKVLQDIYFGGANGQAGDPAA